MSVKGLVLNPRFGMVGEYICMVGEGIVKCDRPQASGDVEACRSRVEVHDRVCGFSDYRKLVNTCVRLVAIRVS